MFKIGDLVTRNSYNNDVVFKIIDIKDDVYYLKGVNVRLCADSDYDDLVGYTEEAEEENDDFFLNTNKYQSLDRSEYFYLPGKVLHIDIGTPIEFYVDGNGIMLKKHEPDNISEKVRELKSIVNDQIEAIGLDQCIAIEDELKKIETILCASPS